jgi:hypothetical protein
LNAPYKVCGNGTLPSSGPNTPALLAYNTLFKPAARAASNTLSVPIRLICAPRTGSSAHAGVSTPAR